MKVKLWGTRGSIPAPGPETIRYGGNTSCVGVTLSDGSLLALDAGTGIRSLGLTLRDEPARLHILLTHLHLDHIQGLVFFAPAFRPQTEIVIWGPASPEASLRDRIARYISAPLSPVEVRELPCDVSFRHCPESEWEIGPARIRAASVAHRGPTLGYRIDDGDSSLTYIPDHEPALGADLDRLEEDWISGFDLARDTSLLIHDGQYSRRRVPRPRRLGPLGACATRSPSPAAPAPSAPSSSTTTRCTPTTSSTASAREARDAGWRWAASRGDRARRRAGRVRAAGAGAERRRDRLARPARPPRARIRPRSRSPALPSCRAVDHPIDAAAERSALVARGARDGARGARRPDPQRQRRHALHRAPAGRRRAAGRARLLGDDVLAAALLHDVVEDSEATVEELRERFGDRVAGLVAALTDAESIDAYRAARRSTGPGRAAGGDALAIYGADKLANVRTLRRVYASQGEAVGAELKVPLDAQDRGLGGDLRMLRRERPELPFLDRAGSASCSALRGGARLDRGA